MLAFKCLFLKPRDNIAKVMIILKIVFHADVRKLIPKEKIN